MGYRNIQGSAVIRAVLLFQLSKKTENLCMVWFFPTFEEIMGYISSRRCFFLIRPILKKIFFLSVDRFGFLLAPSWSAFTTGLSGLKFAVKHSQID